MIETILCFNTWSYLKRLMTQHSTSIGSLTHVFLHNTFIRLGWGHSIAMQVFIRNIKFKGALLFFEKF